MTSSNPSHILIGRHTRGTHPSTSPIETHAAATGVFRLASAAAALGSPPLGELALLEDDEVPELDVTEDNGGVIELDPTFVRDARLPGSVKIVVESTTFWCHKEVLYFASPFFEAILSGSWAETSGRPESISSILTISQPPAVADPERRRSVPGSETAIISADSDASDEPDVDDADGGDPNRADAIAGSLNKLEGGSAQVSPVAPAPDSPRSLRHTDARKRKRRSDGGKRPDAVIVLKEERAQTFQDFLKFVYPNLVCTITWANVEGLLNIAHKLCVPALQTQCVSFLVQHAAGRPFHALRIAELFGEEELFRESSRFVLDNPTDWHDLDTLSPETQLKLERRRTWFLERLLKLGLVQIGKDYQCCPTCPDSANCARILEEKWQQAYAAAFRFGPCQPSHVYRYLRTLEGISPPLSLAHLNCQTTAKAFVATLFDRMFSLGVRGSELDGAPVGVGASAAASRIAPPPAGPRRHFLYCSLREPGRDRDRQRRTASGAAANALASIRE